MKRRRIWMAVLALVILIDLPLFYFLYQRHREKVSHQFEAEIQEASQRYGIDEELIRSIIWQESKFHPDAQGAAGELGLMQIMEIPGEDWSVAEDLETWKFEMLLDPRTNILAGTWYYSKLLKRYPHTDDPYAYALADYNAGRSHVLRWAEGEAETNSEAFIESITFPTTQEYVRNVLERWREE